MRALPRENASDPSDQVFPHPPLVADTDAVLSPTIACQCFETIAQPAPTHAAVRGRTSRSICGRIFCSATAKSYALCRFSQSCGDVPKYRARRIAVSTVMALLPLTIALIRFMGTRSARPSSFRLTPISASSSRSNSPGWMGGSFLRCAMVLLSVIIHDLDFVRVAVTPREADAPAVIDPNAVLAGAVSLQRLQPVAPNSPQIVEARGSVQPATGACGPALRFARNFRPPNPSWIRIYTLNILCAAYRVKTGIQGCLHLFGNAPGLLTGCPLGRAR